jgi:inhibitor of KinA sporulation pathway (predicted exonuclease)
MLELPDKFIIFDLEWTSWPGADERGWSGEGEYREVVEAGAIKVQRSSGEYGEIDRFERYVRPILNPVLDQFFIDLTGITNEKIAAEGVSFNEFLADFTEWSGDSELYSFSGSGCKLPGDLAVLIENCMMHRMLFPLNPGRFHNLYAVFHKFGIEIEQSGSALKAFGLTPRKRIHNGVNDALGLLDGLNELTRREGKY